MRGEQGRILSDEDAVPSTFECDAPDLEFPYTLLETLASNVHEKKENVKLKTGETIRPFAIWHTHSKMLQVD